MARIVLLADDSVTAQNMGRRILTDAGYEVITVNNGSAALKKVHENRPDLIVLDVYMPGYGGLEVCQRLKESGDTMRIPVLLTVGKMEPFKSDEAKRVRADGHIVKPFEASELLAALTKLEDRIVPGTDARGRKGKSDKKSKSWHAGQDAPAAAGEWTDRVAYLAQTKQRVVTHEEETPEATEVASPPPVPKKSAPIEPAPEMAVVADALAEANERVAGFSADSNKKVEAEAARESQASSEAATVEPAVSEAGAESTPQAEVEAATSDARDEAQADAPSQTVSTKPRWVAENVALTAEEAALELEREMQQAQAPAAVTVAASSELPVASATIEGAERKSDERNGAAFAAAASASVSGVSSVAAPAPANSSEEESATAGLDATAAWKNWEQIRDSVMSTHSTEAIAKSVADVAQTANEASTGPSATAVPTAAVSTTQPIEGDALASIVDTVLAELKPKLMEQIAKKLATEKK